MKKVCLVAPMPPPYGGIANWVVLLSEYLQKQGRIELIHVNIAPKKRGLDGRTLWDRVVGQGIAMFAQKRELKRAIKEKNVEVIHMTTSGQLATIRDIQMLKLAKRNKIPTVYHIRFGRVAEIARKNTLEWKLIKRAMRLASKVMAIDNGTYDAIRAYLPKVDVCCVPNPFDLNKMQKVVMPSVSEKSIVYVGWIVKTKGVEELLSAWNDIRSEYPEWTLKLVGPYAQEYYDELDNRFTFDQVLFTGEQPHDMAMEILSKSSVFILPSYTEGFPNSVLEAMALQKPIIATDVGAIPDMLDGCGVVIESRNAAAVADALDRLLSDEQLRTKLGIKGKEKLLKNYTIEKVVEEYERVWEEASAR